MAFWSGKNLDVITFILLIIKPVSSFISRLDACSTVSPDLAVPPGKAQTPGFNIFGF
jgi:hypothetical protein